ncbi:MAG: ATP-binding protein [archaeon]|nr:ATP-binding protein [archaeon]
MAKKRPAKDAETPVKEGESEKERPFSEDERVERTTVDGDTDIFDEFLSNKAKQPRAPPKKENKEGADEEETDEEELKKIVDKNEEGLIEDEEESEEDDSDEEDEDEELEEEEKPAKKKGKEKNRKKEAEEDEEGGKEKSEEDVAEEDEDLEEEDDGEEDEEEPEEDEDSGQKKFGKKEEPEEESTEEDEEEKDAGEEEQTNPDEEPADDNIDKDAHEAGAEEEKEEDEGLEDDEEEEDEKRPGRDEIRATILEKAASVVGDAIPMGERLRFLDDKQRRAVFIGRKANIFKKYGYDAALRVGRVKEREYENYDVFLDSMNPHVVFVCGARGSGKSYVLGVIAEELAEKNRNVGIIVVDPIGVFWSMKFPNKEDKEVEKLREWGMEPKGLANMKVFIPEGVKNEVPKSTYDAGFSIQPSLLTGEDWALTFGVDRFSVSGLLLDKVLKKVEKGYKQTDTNKKIKAMGKNYSIEDLIECLEKDSELNSREKGYKQDSIRAIISRFEAAKSWGIFHEKGTPLGKLSREGQMTVLDTSFLEDNVTALVIGILARRLLAARKISTRKEAANKFKSLTMNELLELEVPPTWLFIDEAHTLIPSGNEVTPATAGLIEYVKQGRRPGLSLVFATQQPSAINTKVLSQLDVIMSHKLIFDDDIKAVFKRTPTIIPKKYRAPNFIKTLPVGVAVTGDRREETSRAFVMAIRPRKSQHEGRDAETTGLSESMDEAQVQRIAVEMIARDVAANDVIDKENARMAIETLNSKYNSSVNFNAVLRKLEERGMVVSDSMITMPGFTQEEAVKQLTQEKEEEEGKPKEESEEGEEATEEQEGEIETGEEEKSESKEEEARHQVPLTELPELRALPRRIGEQEARMLVEKVRQKKLFGLLGNADRIEAIQLKYMPIWRVKYDVMTRGKEFISRECFINSLDGEFMHFKDGSFIESRGLAMMRDASDEDALVIKCLQKRELLIEEVMAQCEIDEAKARRTLQKLIEKGVVSKLTDKKSGKAVYWIKDKLDLPPNERHELLGSLAQLPFVKAESLIMEREKVSKEDAVESLKRLWPSVLVKRTETIYKPLWHIVLSVDAKERSVLIDAVNGKIVA